MTRLRHLIERRPVAVAWLLLIAMALRLIVPAGFMPAGAARGLTLVACPEWGAVPTMAAHHAAHERTGHGEPHRHTEPPCAFAGLGLPTLAAGDFSPLAPRIDAVALAATAHGRALRLAAADRLRPPAQAPPAPV
ncbi:hypothetical protein K7957_00010 [Sphingomonas yunnanensis]|uniref:hypothetical protein n=1 Tax=Sphingomonas yunnanensis TaxID=310400 RepID=UPI001CA69887|nr:hypothetical protein [Sphingomonas yunnanensis]MBY9061315.1 hypothetical protein [Sphingomonas yunnanensis]